MIRTRSARSNQNMTVVCSISNNADAQVPRPEPRDRTQRCRHALPMTLPIIALVTQQRDSARELGGELPQQILPRAEVPVEVAEKHSIVACGPQTLADLAR